MKHTLLLLLATFSYAGLAQTEDGFSDDAFAGEGVSSGMVYAEMSVLVKNEHAKITFDFGTEEDAKELRKEALWTMARSINTSF
jgi:hypothetical protein